MDFELLAGAFPKILAGVDETLMLSLSSLVLGFFLAVPIALMNVSGSFAINAVASGYVYIFRSTPLLVQIFLIYYGSGQFRTSFETVGLWWMFKEAWFCAILALTLNTAAYTSQIIRGGLQSVPFGQIEAAKAIGMSSVQASYRIVFPIALRQALPAYGNEIILLVKATSLASTITILEITGIAKKIMSATYQPIEVFLIAGTVYLLINFTATHAVSLAEYRLNRHTRGSRDSRQLKAPVVH